MSKSSPSFRELPIVGKVAAVVFGAFLAVVVVLFLALVVGWLWNAVVKVWS